MNLLYWNLKSNQNKKYIALLIKEHFIDIDLFFEYFGTNFAVITDTLLSDTYRFHEGYGGCKKIAMLAKKTIQVKINREYSRYVLYSIVCDSFKYILAGMHLPTNSNIGVNNREMIIR